MLVSFFVVFLTFRPCFRWWGGYEVTMPRLMSTGCPKVQRYCSGSISSNCSALNNYIIQCNPYHLSASVRCIVASGLFLPTVLCSLGKVVAGIWYWPVRQLLWGDHHLPSDPPIPPSFPPPHLRVLPPHYLLVHITFLIQYIVILNQNCQMQNVWREMFKCRRLYSYVAD